MKKKISVLVVEHDPMLLYLESTFINSMRNFRVCGRASSLHELEQYLRYTPEFPDLVVMEPFLPFNSMVKAMDLLRPRAGSPAFRSEIIVVSRCPDRSVVEESCSFGLFDDIIKPFVVERFRQSLCLFETYFSRIVSLPEEIDQEQLDRVFRRCAPSSEKYFRDLPKNMNRETALCIVRALHEGGQPLSAEEVAQKCGLSKTTTWRYLSYMVEAGVIAKRDDQGSTGRPLVRYFPVVKKDLRLQLLWEECNKEEINS